MNWLQTKKVEYRYGGEENDDVSSLGHSGSLEEEEEESLSHDDEDDEEEEEESETETEDDSDDDDDDDDSEDDEDDEDDDEDDDSQDETDDEGESGWEDEDDASTQEEFDSSLEPFLPGTDFGYNNKNGNRDDGQVSLEDGEELIEFHKKTSATSTSSSGGGSQFSHSTASSNRYHHQVDDGGSVRPPPKPRRSDPPVYNNNNTTISDDMFLDEPWGKAESLQPPSTPSTFERVHGAKHRRDEESGMPLDDDDEDDDIQAKRKRQMAILLCCCCCILIGIIGAVIGLNISKKNNEKASPTISQPSQQQQQGNTKFPTFPPGTNPPRPTLPPVTMPPVVGGGDVPDTPPNNDGAPSSETKFPRQPTASPVVSLAPVPPPPPFPEEFIILPRADTYIETAVIQDFGQEDTLLVGSHTVAYSLLSFNISELISSKDLAIRTDRSATLRLSHIESSVMDREPYTYRISRLPSTPLSVENLHSGNFVPAGGVIGQTFTVNPSDSIVSIDVTTLLFGQSPFARYNYEATAAMMNGNIDTSKNNYIYQYNQNYPFLYQSSQSQQQSQSSQQQNQNGRSSTESQFFVMIETMEFSINNLGDRFFSRESDNPPQLIITSTTPSSSPTISPAPTNTLQPSIMPSYSFAPSISFYPTMIPVPTWAPSMVPSTNSTTSKNNDNDNDGTGNKTGHETSLSPSVSPMPTSIIATDDDPNNNETTTDDVLYIDD